MRKLLLAIAAAVTFSGPLAVAASTWEIDPAHTSVQFAVRHMMVSTVRGTLGTVTGVVNLDESDVTKSTVEATIDVAGTDTREPKRDGHLRSPDLLDVSKYPTITFKSKRVTKEAEDRYGVTGDLTIRDVTKELIWDANGKIDGNEALGTAKTNFKFGYFNLNQPRVPRVLSIVDDIKLELDLYFRLE